jgi:hypothetical protein
MPARTPGRQANVGPIAAQQAGQADDQPGGHRGEEQEAGPERAEVQGQARSNHQGGADQGRYDLHEVHAANVAVSRQRTDEQAGEHVQRGEQSEHEVLPEAAGVVGEDEQTERAQQGHTGEPERHGRDDAHPCGGPPREASTLGMMGKRVLETEGAQPSPHDDRQGQCGVEAAALGTQLPGQERTRDQAAERDQQVGRGRGEELAGRH